MNVKTLKAIRSYCRFQKFDEKYALQTFKEMDKPRQQQLLAEIRRFIQNKRNVGSRGRKVSSSRTGFPPLVSTDTIKS